MITGRVCATSGTTTYTFGTHSGGTSSSTLTTTDDASIYQAKATGLTALEGVAVPVDYTPDAGYRVVKNGATQTTGSITQPSAGWGDIRTASGAGVVIGTYQAAAYYPKSLAFNNGGTDTRIGIWAGENSIPYYQTWPEYSTHDLFFDFHDTALASPSNDFLKFQDPLLARASLDTYNTAGVFPYPFVDAAAEDAYYKATQQAANPSIDAGHGCCLPDLGVTSAGFPLTVYRNYAWPNGGPLNQFERHWSYLIQWLVRGMPGRYLEAAHFYRYLQDFAFPRSDGFNWRDQNSAALNPLGYPSATSLNSSMSYRSGPGWDLDLNHAHWYGIGDYYFMSGDEGVKDQIVDGIKDHLLSPVTYPANGYLPTIRSIGHYMMATARLGRFFDDIGDTGAATTVRALADTIWTQQINNELCLSNNPACPAGFVGNNLNTWTDRVATDGFNSARGVAQGDSAGSGTEVGCPASYQTARIDLTYQKAIWINGLIEQAQYRGPGWSNYWKALDFAYGGRQWADAEMYKATGNNRWSEDGYRYLEILDVANNQCPSLSGTWENGALPNQTLAAIWMADQATLGSPTQESRFKIIMQKVMSSEGLQAADYASAQWNTIIYRFTHPATKALQNVPITSIASNGGGSYTLSWTVPTGTTSYRIKWSPKTIVSMIGFDPGTNTFIGNPTTQANWFAATNVSAPAPSGAGTTQSVTISTGTEGLAAANFSVKAYVGGGGGGTPTPTPTPTPAPSAGPRPPLTLWIADPGTPAPLLPSPTPEPAPLPGAPTAVTWTKQAKNGTWPASTGYTSILYDPYTRRVLFYFPVSGTGTIYGSDIFAYDTATNTFERHPNGNATTSTSCPAERTNPVWPGDRHAEQMAVDTTRHVLWVWAGVCQGRFDGLDHTDRIWMLNLNTTLANATWKKLQIITKNPAEAAGEMIYSPADDVLFLHGGDGNGIHEDWVFCPAASTLSAAQVAAGCKQPNDWSEVCDTPSDPCYSNKPPASMFPGMWYDTATRKAILFGGQNAGGTNFYNQIWSYDIPTRTWTNKNPASPPPAYTGREGMNYPAMAYDSINHRFLYRQTTSTGAPKDWSYDPVPNTWSPLAQSSGPVPDSGVDTFLMTYDEANRTFVAIVYNPTSDPENHPVVWHGVWR